MKFEEGGGCEVNDLLIGSHLIVSEEFRYDTTLPVDIDVMGIKVRHGIEWIVLTNALIVKICIVLIQSIESIVDAISKNSILRDVFLYVVLRIVVLIKGAIQIICSHDFPLTRDLPFWIHLVH